MPARPTTRRRRRSSSHLATELAIAAPQVIAQRLTRIAAAGANPSARDRREWQRMVSEKGLAFGEAWQAMAWQALRSQQALVLAAWQAWLGGAASTAQSMLTLSAPSASRGATGALRRELQRAAAAIAAEGLAPLHRTAVANARRLSRSARRR